MVYDLLMQRDADGRLLDFLQQLLHEVTNLRALWLSRTTLPLKVHHKSQIKIYQKSLKM